MYEYSTTNTAMDLIRMAQEAYVRLQTFTDDEDNQPTLNEHEHEKRSSAVLDRTITTARRSTTNQLLV